MSTPTDDVRDSFNKYKKALIAELGPKALDDLTVNKVGKQLFGARWGGVWPIDRVRLKPNRFLVVNTDPHHKPGEHWIAVYCSKTRAYIYDSYGRPIDKLVPLLIDAVKKANMKIGHTNMEPHGEQVGFKSEVCGHCSLSFLLVVQAFGIARAKRI